MVQAPITLQLLLLFVVLLGVALVVLQIRAISYAYRVIGVSPRYVTVTLLLTLLGSYVNVPLYAVPVARLVPPQVVEHFGRTYVVPPMIEPGLTLVAINVGGALIPLLVSIYLFLKTRARLRLAMAVAIVAVVVHQLAQIVPGVGIAVPMLAPPLVAVAVALLLAYREAPAVAYVAGSLGTLIGADLWNLPRIDELGAPIVSIGGAALGPRRAA